MIGSILLWFVYMIVFAAISLAMAIAAGEILLRQKRPSSGMPELPCAILAAALSFWGLCLAVLAATLIRDHSGRGIVKALIVFLPGGLLGTAVILVLPPVWGSLRKRWPPRLR